MMEIEEIWIEPQKIVFDSGQPRKTFDNIEIENLAKTYKTHGIINAPEIDENRMVITGELRVRAAVKAQLKKIKCNIIKNLSETERRERQIIENLHLHRLETNEYEEAIVNLYEKGKNEGRYKTQAVFAEIIGVSEPELSIIIKSYKTRLEYDLNDFKLSTQNVYAISRLNNSYREQLISQLKAGVAPINLVEYVSKLKSMPDDIKKQILRVNNPLSIKDAEVVAQFKTPEERKEIIDEIRYTQKTIEDALTYKLKISKGEIEPLPEVIETENQTVRYYRNLFLNLKSRMVIEYLKPKLSEESFNACIEYMIQLRDHLNNELEKVKSTIPIKKVIDISAIEK